MNIVQAVVCRPPCLLSRRKWSPDAVRSRNPSKSTLAHDAVAAAVSRKHYSIIHRDHFFSFYCLFRQRFLSAYLLKLFLLPQRVHATLFIRCDKPELTRWCLCSLHSDIQMSPAVTVVAIPSQKALLMRPYISSYNFSVLVPRCSRALLHNLQPTSDCRLILASHVATRMIPAIAIIFRRLCLQGMRGSFKCFPKNALLSLYRNMKSLKSAVHMPYAG